MIAINVRLSVAIELISGRSYQNIYEWAQEQSRLGGWSTEDVLRERLDRFYGRRTAFDRAFKDGERFRYGTLNAGGAGLPEYAPYCVVLTQTFQSALTDAVCLPGDSLLICFAATVTFSGTRWSCPPFLIATDISWLRERATEVLAAVKQAWPTLVASPGRYFEVVFLGEFSRDAVACIRISKTEYDRMWGMAFGSAG